jgi:hypothetical protein
MLMSEFESSMNILQHQESGFGVFHGESLHIGCHLLLTQVLDILPVMIRSVLSQLEKVLCQWVSWILKSEGIVCGWDDAVLGSCFTSESHRCVTYSLVQNSIWENVIVTLNTHNESSEVEVFGWCWLIPHFGENVVHTFESIHMLLDSRIHHSSILLGSSLEHHLASLSLLVSLWTDGNMEQNEPMFVNTAVEFSD